jgi:O-antigen/teichoic acid export membrane protein
LSPESDPQHELRSAGTRPATGGALLSGASRITVAATGALATIVVAHLLGPRGVSALAIAQTLVIMLMVATTLGAEHGIVYFVSSGQWRAADAYRTSQRLALVSGTVAVGLGVLARIVLPNAFHGLSFPVTVTAAVALPFALSWYYASYVALASDHYELYALPPAIQSFAALLLIATLGAANGIPGVVLGMTIAHALAAVCARVMARRDLARSAAPNEPVRRQLRRAISFGIRGYASNALQFLNNRLDLLILNASAISAVVGHYAVAVSVTSLLLLLPQALSDVLFPRVAALSARSGLDSQEWLRATEAKSIRHCVLATVIVAILLAVALVVLVVPIYGASFQQSTDLGLILLPGVAALGVANLFSVAVTGRGRVGLPFAGALVVTPLTVLLYIVLIPQLHATGAALASTISYTATLLLTASLYRHVTGEQPLRLLVPTRSEVMDYVHLAGRARGWYRDHWRDR